MDEFWTEAENDLRSRASGLLRGLAGPGQASAEGALAELRSAADESLSGRVAILDEAARRDPRFGDGLMARLAASRPLEPAELTACLLGRLAGTADHVFEAGTRAAREKGFFSSILMDFRKVQERLAGLVSGAELARFGACRLCRLLERGDRDRAGRESGALRARAAVFDAEVRSVAALLLGPDWAAGLAPFETISTADERTTP